MKKVLLCFALCISLIMGSFLPVKEAQASTIEADRIITPMFTYINAFNNTFNILGAGEANCGSYLSFRNADSAKIVIYLERYENGKWVVIKTWMTYALLEDIYAYCYGVHNVPSGYQYRMSSIGFVYVGGLLVETVSQTFAPQYY